MYDASSENRNATDGRDVLRDALAAQRDGLLHGVVDLLGRHAGFVEDGIVEAGVDPPRADAVHADPVLGEVDRHLAGELQHRALGRVVGDAVRLTDERRRRSGVHDAASALALHVRDHRARHQQHAPDVDGEVEIPVLEALRERGAGDQHAGVVVQQVDPAEALDAGGDHAVDAGLVADVTLQGERRVPSASRSATVSSAAASRTSATATEAPSRASRSALWRPIEPPAPVTSATFPMSRLGNPSVMLITHLHG